MKVTTEEFKAQITKLVEMRYANALRKAGFHSYKDENICWFKVHNREMIQSVCFYSCWKSLPVLPLVAYASFPAYIDNSLPFDGERVSDCEPCIAGKFRSAMGFFNSTPVVYSLDSDGAAVVSHYQENRHEEFINTFISEIGDITTPERFFEEIQKENQPSQKDFYLSGGTDFVLYNGIEEMYPQCLEHAKSFSEHYLKSRNVCKKYAKAWAKPHIAHLRALTEDRLEYVAMLEERKQALLSKLERGGVPIE